MSLLKTRVKALETASNDGHGASWTAVRVFLDADNPTKQTDGPTDQEVEARRRQGFDVTVVNLTLDDGN